MKDKNNNIILGTIIGLSIIISSMIGAFSFYSIRSLNDVISVTGSTKVQVKSDKVKWIARVSRTVKESQIKLGYSGIDSDLKQVKAFYLDNGVKESDMNISLIYMNEIYNNDRYAERQYSIYQTIEMNSDKVLDIKNLAEKAQSLTQKGIIFETSSLQYFYSKLPELRVSLLGEAIKDAKARAEQIAQSGGQSIGSLKSASSGVVQVISPNSIDVSDYGQYDTSTIDKEVMITVRATFAIK